MQLEDDILEEFRINEIQKEELRKRVKVEKQKTKKLR